MKTLQELLDALKAGTVPEVRAMLDNDQVSFYDGNDESVLELHPYDLQVQALEALGIEAESV